MASCVASNSAIGLISLYQRRISPYKGYVCAHRVHHGQSSCSEFAKQAIAANGLFSALPSIRHRFIECRAAYGAMQSAWKGNERIDKDSPPSSVRHAESCVNACAIESCGNLFILPCI